MRLMKEKEENGKNPKIYRQGDVLMVEVDDLPTDLSPIPMSKGDHILAWGEVTNHAHRLKGKTSHFYQHTSGARYLTVPKEAPLTHEEHDTIKLPKGNYRIIQQVEYQKEFRPVVD